MGNLLTFVRVLLLSQVRNLKVSVCHCQVINAAAGAAAVLFLAGLKHAAQLCNLHDARERQSQHSQEWCWLLSNIACSAVGVSPVGFLGGLWSPHAEAEPQRCAAQRAWVSGVARL